MTASVTAGGAPVTIGFVTFREGSVPVGTAPLQPDGTATLRVQFPPGAFTLTARFNGSNAGQPSVSIGTTLVQKGRSSTAVAVSSAQGGDYNLTATVTSNQAAFPSGTVTFTDQSTGKNLGSAQLAPAAIQSSIYPELLPTGIATYADLFLYGDVVSGDFNGDGMTDYAVLGKDPTSDGQLLYTYLGNPDGTFRRIPPGPARYYRLMTGADFNNDGKTDLIVSPDARDSMVLLSNGDGTFNPTNLTAGFAYLAADFNGDGKLDALEGFASPDSTTETILFGDGTGTFTGGGTGSLPPGVVEAPPADYNNDGNIDVFGIIATNPTDPNFPNAAQFVPGKGDGSFGPGILASGYPTNAGGYPAESLGAVNGDFNGDGILDLAAYDGQGSVYILLGDGTGHFHAPTGAASVKTGPIIGFTALDVNGDGIVDLIAVPSSAIGANNTPSPTPQVVILLGDGTGHFTLHNGINSVPVTNPLLGTGGIGSLPANASATATITVAGLGSGAHSIIATYAGNAVLSASVSASSQIAGSSSIDFPQGFSSAVLNRAGSAAIVGSVLRLTDGRPNEAASAFYPTPVDIRSFVSNFTFKLSGDADGFTFTMQNQSPHALGGSGGTLGYAGISKSAAVKFDLFNNQGEGINSTGLYTDGQTPTTPAIDLGSKVNLHSGHTLHAHLVYDGSTLNVTIMDTITGASATQSYPLNLIQHLGATTGYVGFTAGTGGLSATQDIVSWSYSPLPFYPAFTSQGLALNGGTSLVGSTLHLTSSGVANQARSAYFSTPVDIRQFTTDFTFQSVNAIADGFTFTLQNAGTTAIGASGGGLGYAGISRSVAIKFDLYSNAGEGINSTGFYVEGASPTAPAIDLAGTGINLHSQDPVQAHITYDGKVLNVILTDTVTMAVAKQSYTMNIPSQVGSNTAFAGFTAGTGSLSASQSIVSWTFLPSQ